MQCPICQMGYCPGLPDNEEAHNKYHDEVVNGLPVPAGQEFKHVADIGNYQIVLVDALSASALFAFAYQVAVMFQGECGFGKVGPTKNSKFDSHAFLAVYDGRAVAILVLERRSNACVTTWQEYEGEGPMPAFRIEAGRWSVCFIAVHRKHRNRGLAKSLVRIAAGWANCDLADLGWYTPFTEAGAKLVKSFCPMQFNIIK